MSTTLIKHPLDLTGQSPDNLVVGEPHSIGATGNRAIVLNHGPFYTRDLVVRQASNGSVLTPRVHYKAAQLFPEATLKTGQEICTVIVVDDISVGTDFLIDYQTLGGEYSASVEAIAALIETLELDERPVRWGAILGKPVYFPPTPHLHDLGDLYGFEYIVAAIEGVRQAILLGDVYKDQEIYDYIDRQDTLLSAQITNVATDINTHIGNLNNPHQTTKAQVGLSSVENLPLASDSQAKAGTSHVTYMTPLRTKAAVDVHAMRVDNPHNVTKAQVGLSLVANYSVATLPQALAGTATDKYLTPFLAQAMIDQALENQVPPEPPYVAPTARYTTSGSTNVNYDQSHVITFTDQSTAGSRPITGYFWEFGDGTTSTSQSPPAKTYANAGAYNTKLTVTDDQANTRTYAITLTLTKNAAPAIPPTVDFTWTGAQTTTDPNNPVIDFAPAVTAGSAAIASYLWEYSVGAAGSSTLANPGPYTYVISIGTVTKTVRLTVTDVNGLASSKTKTITLTKSASNVAPTANFSYTGATTVTSPANHVITFTDQSVNGTGTINSWAWVFGDGTTYNGKTPPAKQYNIAVGSQSFTVKLTTTDTNGLSHFKQISLNLSKNAAPLDPPIANFNTGGSLTVMEGSNHSISVTDTSTIGSANITSWLWDWGDGTTSSGKTPAAHTYVVPVGSTVRTIKLTVTDANGKSDFLTKSITLVKTAITPPTAAFTKTGALTVTEPSNHVIDFNDASTNGTGAINKWVWTFGDGTSYTGQNPPPHTYAAPIGSTSYTVKLVVTDVNSRTATSQQVITLVKNKFTLAVPTNLNFDAGDTGWVKSGSMVISSAGAAAHSGSWRARINYVTGGVGNTANTGGVIANGGFPVTPGDYITARCYVKPVGGSDSVGGTCRLIWLDYWGNGIGNKAGNIVEVAFTPNVWTQSSASQAAPAGAYYYTVQGDGFAFVPGSLVEFDTFTHTNAGPYDPGTPVTGPGGPGSCVASTMYLTEDLQAGDAVAGDVIDGSTYDPIGKIDREIIYNATSVQPTYRMVTESGIALIASDSTPFTLQDGSSKFIGEMLGELVLVDDEGDIRWEIVTVLIPAGMREITRISINDHSFFAGEIATRRIASHNVVKN